jgi:hypothetical protein
MVISRSSLAINISERDQSIFGLTFSNSMQMWLRIRNTCLLRRSSLFATTVGKDLAQKN